MVLNSLLLVDSTLICKGLCIEILVMLSVINSVRSGGSNRRPPDNSTSPAPKSSPALRVFSPTFSGPETDKRSPSRALCSCNATVSALSGRGPPVRTRTAWLACKCLVNAAPGVVRFLIILYVVFLFVFSGCLVKVYLLMVVFGNGGLACNALTLCAKI